MLLNKGTEMDARTANGQGPATGRRLQTLEDKLVEYTANEELTETTLTNKST
jgi:hypothetical protein